MTETEFRDTDMALQIIYNDIVKDPTAIPADRPREGDVVARDDRLFGHGSAHRIVIQGPETEEPIAVEFLVYRSFERDLEQVYGHWMETGIDAQTAFDRKCQVINLVDPFNQGDQP